jgi:hypothetical protein
LNIAQTAGTLGIGALALVETLSALAFNLSQDARESRRSRLRLNGLDRVPKAVADQSFRVGALLESNHAQLLPEHTFPRGGLKICDPAIGCRAKAETDRGFEPCLGWLGHQHFHRDLGDRATWLAAPGAKSAVAAMIIWSFVHGLIFW